MNAKRVRKNRVGFVGVENGQRLDMQNPPDGSVLALLSRRTGKSV
ncbi:MAG: hypothetical protein ACOVSW_12115 [Candidatus Kapaibacteriota bacterium]